MKAILLLFVLFPHKALEEQLGQKYSNWVQKNDISGLICTKQQPQK